jgi:hypothetical protein
MYRRDCSKSWVRHLTATPSNKAQAEWPEPEDKTSLRQIELPSQVANSTTTSSTSNTTSTASGTFSVLLIQLEVQKVERQGSSTVTTGTVLVLAA